MLLIIKSGGGGGQKLELQGALIAHLSTMSTSVVIKIS